MNLAERMAANDDYGYDEDSVHTLLKKHEVCNQRTFSISFDDILPSCQSYFIYKNLTRHPSCKMLIMSLF